MDHCVVWVEYNRTYAFGVIREVNKLLYGCYPGVHLTKFCSESKALNKIPRLVSNGVLRGIIISTVKRMSNGTAGGVIIPGFLSCGGLLLSTIKMNQWSMPVVVYSGEVNPKKPDLPKGQALSISVYDGSTNEVAKAALEFIFKKRCDFK